MNEAFTVPHYHRLQSQSLLGAELEIKFREYWTVAFSMLTARKRHAEALSGLASLSDAHTSSCRRQIGSTNAALDSYCTLVVVKHKSCINNRYHGANAPQRLNKSMGYRCGICGLRPSGGRQYRPIRLKAHLTPRRRGGKCDANSRDQDGHTQIILGHDLR